MSLFSKIKNLIKFLLGEPRIAPTSGKTLLYIWIKEDLKNFKGDLGVDFGGGTMQNKKYFATKKYVCVDSTKSELDKGLIENPDAIAVNMKMQDYMKKNLKEKADFLLCVQTMGSNHYFQHNETFETIKQMYLFLKPARNRVFNIGITDKSLNELKDQIVEFFNKKFQSLDVRDYGDFDIAPKKPSWPVIILFYAYLMKIFFPFRNLFNFKKNKIYFVCKNKL